jgi:hypothetical protein
MLAAVGLSQLQSSIMPPLHFFICIVQRGIIIMFIAGMAGIIGIIVGIPIVGRSIVVIVVLNLFPEVVVISAAEAAEVMTQQMPASMIPQAINRLSCLLSPFSFIHSLSD